MEGKQYGQNELSRWLTERTSRRGVRIWPAGDWSLTGSVPGGIWSAQWLRAANSKETTASTLCNRCNRQSFSPPKGWRLLYALPSGKHMIDRSACKRKSVFASSKQHSSELITIASKLHMTCIVIKVSCISKLALLGSYYHVMGSFTGCII